jgi:hypothetical protein
MQLARRVTKIKHLHVLAQRHYVVVLLVLVVCGD